MQLISRLQKSRHGIYYLRIQRDGIDRRWSLRTRDPHLAAIAAHDLSATLLRMKFNPNQFTGFILKSDGDKLELSTEDNDKDREAGTAAFLAAQQQQLDSLRARLAEYERVESLPRQPVAPTPVALVESKPVVTLGFAIEEYEPVLFQTDNVEKSKRQALSTLNDLKSLLGAKFDMFELTDETIEDRWLPYRLKTVGLTTAKRDLSFIRKFVEWSAHRARKYSPATLTFTIKAEGEHYEYFDAADLRLIFDNLPDHAVEAWQFWIVVLGLYTGARIGEIASLKVSYFSVKSRLNVMFINGTKTNSSPRTIPVHPDLVRLGLLDYVADRARAKKKMLFDVTRSALNGWGDEASGWFTDYKAAIKLTEERKVFHSFRHTITDLLNQASVLDKAGAQYTGHSNGSNVRNGNYGRKPLSMTVMQSEVIDKIDWYQYCCWQPDFDVLGAKAKEFLT